MKNKIAIFGLLCIINLSSCWVDNENDNRGLEKWETINFEIRKQIPDKVDINNIWIDIIKTEGKTDLINLK